jgi:hypothetical protein
MSCGHTGFAELREPAKSVVLGNLDFRAERALSAHSKLE